MMKMFSKLACVLKTVNINETEFIECHLRIQENLQHNDKFCAHSESSMHKKISLQHVYNLDLVYTLHYHAFTHIIHA